MERNVGLSVYMSCICRSRPVQQRGVLPAGFWLIRTGVCRFLDMNFSEFLFPALG
jgi:hypothetical protein